MEEARTFFNRVGGDVSAHLSRMDAHSEELDAVERLAILHDFYPEEETEFRFD